MPSLTGIHIAGYGAVINGNQLVDNGGYGVYYTGAPSEDLAAELTGNTITGNNIVARLPVTAVPGASVFGHADAFAMIRGGHVDIAVLGALQVSAAGDLANWTVPGAGKGGIGGAMDLAAGAREVYAIMTHLMKDGGLKLLEECTYPLTARRVVKKLFTDIAFIEFGPEGPLLREAAPGLTPDDIQRVSAPKLILPSPVGTYAAEG